MALFHHGKKEMKSPPARTCGYSPSESAESVNNYSPQPDSRIYSIKVLGSGCASCHTQYEHVKAAIDELGLSINAEYITDLKQVMEYGVMRMPALVVNENVVSMGRVLKPDEIQTLLNNI